MPDPEVKQASLEIVGQQYIEERPLPDGVPDLSEHREECRHCHNSVNSMHILECTDCGDVHKGLAIQEKPLCGRCGGVRECLRYTRRTVEPEGGTSREHDRRWMKRCFHPATGEVMSPEDLRDQGYR